jgi:hypothetical protein
MAYVQLPIQQIWLYYVNTLLSLCKNHIFIQAVTLLTCFWDVCTVRILAATLTFLTEVFHSYPQFLEAKCFLPYPVLYISIVVQVFDAIQGVPTGKVNILGGHSIGQSKQTSVYVHVSYGEQFLR